jgi:lipopolysaccharide transport system ATP-binding protein
MSNLAIRVENLSKQYRIGAPQPRYKTIRESLMNGLTVPVRRLRSTFQPSNLQPANDNYVWALKDVSFNVKQGEVVGIIGRNGAGKSTLLKILSRITEPTEGRAEVYGRVGSLLEVGTGFHPELTGRENIYLNGAILGMKKAEIERKFDEIVAFAEVEKFIDTPIKHYSSGMYVRLAFAVAAHLEPEILLVDEVLSVGDAAFQKKCLGKMGEVAKEGRTVLFVSHNMPAVLALCQRAVFLERGAISLDATAQKVVETYLAFTAGGAAEVLWEFNEAPGNHIAKLRAVRVCTSAGEVSRDHQISQPIILEMQFWCLGSAVRLNTSFLVHNSIDTCIFAANNFSPDSAWSSALYQPGLYRASAVIPGGLLNEGSYRVTPVVLKDHTIWAASRDNAISFHVHDDGYGRGDFTSTWIGVIRPLLHWTLTRESGFSAQPTTPY